MLIKNVCTAMLYGAASALGSMFIIKGSEVLLDPHKRAVIKRSITTIKNTFIGKNESK